MKTIAELLRGVPLFAELGEADLERIAAGARIEELAAGARLIEEGSPPTAMYVVVDGSFAITKRGSAGPLVLNQCGPGDLLGELAVLEGRTARTATVTATSAARVVVLDTAALHDLLRGSLAATLAILRTMAARIANTEGVLRQHDTLSALGRMAAGLAHELNNPAAAIQRGAGELARRIAELEARAVALREVAAMPALPQLEPPIETAMARARRERALEDALGARGVASPWELAPGLAAIGCDAAALDRMLAGVPAAAIAPVLRWLEAIASAQAIARDVGIAATRISELVHAVRTHTRLGEAPIQQVDLHAALDATLALVRHRLDAITVHRDYAPDLPSIEAYGGELNQVWMNLVDNAIAAIGAAGELTIATRRAGDHVVVEVIDSGPGIPAELHAEVWKPFFTTKPPGEGTGLGLHLAYNVVVARHRGTITFDSKPGRTCFRVTLPIGHASAP